MASDMPAIPDELRRDKAPIDVLTENDDSRLDEPNQLEIVELPEDIHYQALYYVKGSAPKFWKNKFYISDPPNAGWSHAFVVGKPDAKRVTVFCPFTLEAFQVPRHAGELADVVPEVLTLETLKRLTAVIQDNWRTFQGLGLSKDYDTATLVLKRLGAEVPEQVMKGGEEDTRRKGGKEVGGELLKPVKKSSKRGKFLQWFLEGGSARSVREAMAEFSMTRSNALSYLYMLQKDHGIGYELAGDVATVSLPAGCEDPFGDGQPVPEPEQTAEPEPEPDDGDDSWLDGDDDSWLD